jgi:hypothetical protein
MTYRGPWMLLVATVVCAGPITTYAADPPPSHSPQALQARQRFDRGVALLAESKWGEAIAELEAARAIYPTAPIHFNLGLAYRSAGRARDAIASFERYKRAVGDSADPARQAEVARYLTTLRASLAQIELDITPTDARVLIDNEPAPRATGLIEIDPGPHTIFASAEGYSSMTRALTLQPGSTTRMRIQLEHAERRPRLVVATDVRDSTIRVNGVVKGRGSIDTKVETGHHVIEIDANGYHSERREVNLGIGAHESLTVMLKRKRKVAGWVVLGVVAAGVVGGAVATGVVLSTKDEAPIVPELGVVYTGLEVAKW